MTNAPRPGWYPDPAGASDAYRWWDGETWTDHLSESANAPAPSPTPSLAPALTPSLAPALTSGTDEPAAPRRRSPFRVAVALIVVIAMFLGAGLGVGLWLWDVGTGGTRGETDTGGRTSAPRGPVSAAPVEPPGQLDESTRTATIGAASLELPDDPYRLQADPMRVRGVLDPLFMADAEVHDRYDGEYDWDAMVALAAVDPDLAAQPDLASTGRQTMARLAAAIYGTKVTKVTRQQVADRSIDGCAGLEFTADVHYAVDRLPSRYDRVRAVVVKLDDGTVVAAISSVPNDADDELSELAEKALDSLSIG